MMDQSETSYKVAHVGQAAEQLKTLMIQAMRLGMQEEFLETVKDIAQRLATSPLEWGDPLYQFRHLGLLLH